MNEFAQQPKEFDPENALLDQQSQRRLNELRATGIQRNLTTEEQAERQALQLAADEALELRRKEPESL
ncbi:MAG: hypothetical protein NTY30_05015 [Candidatus Berkelbacteria bacterium]|nr:hypothetical protein [Candidatus Berkelbacteria bacterium]